MQQLQSAQKKLSKIEKEQMNRETRRSSNGRADSENVVAFVVFEDSSSVDRCLRGHGNIR